MEEQLHTSRLEDSKQWINNRVEDSKQWVNGKVEQIKPAVRNAGMKVQRELHEKPALWAGVAAGIGFAAGLAGRIARHRRHRFDDAETYVILEAC